MRRRTWRRLLYADTILAGIPAVMCLVDPPTFVAQYFSSPLDWQGEQFVRWLGGVYAFYAYLMWRGLRYGDRNFWTVWAPAAVLGDALALASFLYASTSQQFVWALPSLVTLGFYGIYLPVRVAVMLDPSRVDRETP